MAITLIFNPGSASLKFEVIEVSDGQRYASDARKLFGASLEGIGKEAKLLVFDGGEVSHTEPCPVRDMAEGTRTALRWIENQGGPGVPALQDLALVGVRVVHGGDRFSASVRVDERVRQEILNFEELAPLHNRSSIQILDVLAEALPKVPLFVAFDTAFHRTIPEAAWRYPIERGTADRYGIRKFGFHGLSHRYMLDRYIQISQSKPDEVSIVTLHLESGSSAAAIRRGESVDTTMGFTPLEGLMMGTRCGSIDASIVSYLMRRENVDAGQVMDLLNNRSGLLGIAGQSFDTRDLVKRGDPAAQLAIEMFAYRVRLAVGAYLAALGDAQAILFGGGIGVDTPVIRSKVCAGLQGWGLELDADFNHRITSGEARITRPSSRLHAFVIPVEEGQQIAHEAYLAFQSSHPAQ